MYVSPSMTWYAVGVYSQKGLDPKRNNTKYKKKDVLGSTHTDGSNPILDTKISVCQSVCRNAQGTPPGFWNGVDWRGLVK